MKLLERYLLQVERYLPLSERTDTSLELKNLLLEDIEQRTLNGQPEEDAEFEVIKAFGDPKIVALKYRNDAPIISREMEPLLYMIIKIIIVAVPLSLLLASSISFLNNGLPFNFIDFLVNIVYTIPDMFSAALSGVGTVFIVIALIERYFKPRIIEELEKEGMLEFDPLKLPKIPDSIFKVSIFESIFGITAGIVFVFIFNYQPGLIAVYFDGNSIPLLTVSFSRILPVINVSIVFGISIEFLHLVLKRKTIITSTLEFMNKMLTTVIFILLATNDILNEVVIAGYGLEVLSVMFVIGMSIGAIANFITGIVTYVKVFIAQSGKKIILNDLVNKK